MQKVKCQSKKEQNNLLYCGILCKFAADYTLCVSNTTYELTFLVTNNNRLK
jgi:hypothetical protein